METHSRILAWKIPMEPGRLQSSSVQSLSPVQFFETPWTEACQASLSITSSRSLPKVMAIESVMPFNHFIFCCPLLFLPSIFPRIRVFSSESAQLIRKMKVFYFCLRLFLLQCCSFLYTVPNFEPILLSSSAENLYFLQGHSTSLLPIN